MRETAAAIAGHHAKYAAEKKIEELTATVVRPTMIRIARRVILTSVGSLGTRWDIITFCWYFVWYVGAHSRLVRKSNSECPCIQWSKYLGFIKCDDGPHFNHEIEAVAGVDIMVSTVHAVKESRIVGHAGKTQPLHTAS